MWFPPKLMMCHTQLIGLHFHSALGQCRLAAQAGSLSMNYGGSRISQMLAELVLQWSVLHFARKEKRVQKNKK
jgi:hypothetical protein